MLKILGLFVAAALTVSACGGSSGEQDAVDSSGSAEDDRTADGDESSADTNTELVVTDAEAPASIEVVDGGVLPEPMDPINLGSGEPVAEESPVFVRQFDEIPTGRSVFTVTGVPVSLDFGQGWLVRENTAALTVFTDTDSRSGDVRDVTLFRPTALSNPDDPTFGGPGRQFWSVEDIRGWLDRVPPGILSTSAVDATVGGEPAVRFDVQLVPELTCSEDVYCVDFAIGEAEQYEDFDPDTQYRVWWVDGVNHEPLVIIVTARKDNGDFLDVANELLSTIRLGDVMSHPIGANIVDWECGFTSMVPSRPVTLPVAGGLQLDLPTSMYITQNAGVAEVHLLRDEDRFVMLAPVADARGNPVTTIEDLIAAIANLGVEVGETTTTTMLGMTAEAFDVERGSAGFDAVLVTETGGGPLGWRAPALGRVWVAETDRGLVLAAAHASNSATALGLAIEDANEIIPTLALTEHPCP